MGSLGAGSAAVLIRRDGGRSHNLQLAVQLGCGDPWSLPGGEEAREGFVVNVPVDSMHLGQAILELDLIPLPEERFGAVDREEEEGGFPPRP
jgi:hypothetical protein